MYSGYPYVAGGTSKNENIPEQHSDMMSQWPVVPTIARNPSKPQQTKQKQNKTNEIGSPDIASDIAPAGSLSRVHPGR